MFNTGIISKNRKYFYTCFLSYESQYIFGNVIVLLKSWGKQSFYIAITNSITIKFKGEGFISALVFLGEEKLLYANNYN